MFVCPIGGTLLPPCCLLSVSPSFLKRGVFGQKVSGRFFNTYVYIYIYILLSPVCIFITKFYIAVDPLVSAQRCLAHPELLFLSNQYCGIAWQTASLSFKASPPLSWNSFIKRAASPGEKSHKSRWNSAFFLSYHCVTKCSRYSFFCVKVVFFLSSLFFCSLLIFHDSAAKPSAFLFALSWLRSSLSNALIFSLGFWGIFCLHNHQWFASIFIACASPPAVTALTAYRKGKGKKTEKVWHFPLRETVCVLGI